MFNPGILFNGVLIANKLLNNPFASCSFINLDFLLPHTAHFHDNTNLPFLVFIILHLYPLYFSCTINNNSACSFYNVGNIFLKTYFKHFVFMELSDLNSNLNNLFDSSFNKDFFLLIFYFILSCA